MTDVKNYDCYYDDRMNEAIVHETSLEVPMPKEPDYELIEDHEGYEIHDFNGVRLTVPLGTETKEQLVILFANLLGLRAVAADY